jgi:hypothetical protein
MTPQLAIFVLAALAVLGALSLIFQRHPIHSALSLIVVMIALAGLYLLMGANSSRSSDHRIRRASLVLFVFVIIFERRVEERTNVSKLAGVAGIRWRSRCSAFSPRLSRVRMAQAGTVRRRPRKKSRRCFSGSLFIPSS